MKKAAKKSNGASRKRLTPEEEWAEFHAGMRVLQRKLDALAESDRKRAVALSALIEAQRKHDEVQRKHDEAQRKHDEANRKRDESDRRRAIELGGISRTQGLIAEELFTREFARLMAEAGIKLTEVKRRVRKRNHGAECDIVGLNGNTAVVGEVKTRLFRQDVEKLLGRLPLFREDFPKMARKKIYGAVAGMTIDRAAEDLARKQGLFVLAQSGAGFSSHTPPQTFTPKAF